MFDYCVFHLKFNEQENKGGNGYDHPLPPGYVSIIPNNDQDQYNRDCKDRGALLNQLQGSIPSCQSLSSHVLFTDSFSLRIWPLPRPFTSHPSSR